MRVIPRLGFLLSLLPVLLPIGPSVHAEPFAIDKAHTSVHFAVSHFGRSLMRGRWMNIEGQLDYDAPGRTGAVDLAIDPATLDTGLPALDNVLKSEQFFNTEEFRTVRFKSVGFVFDGERLSAINGFLTLHGETVPVRLLADNFRCGEVKIMALRRYVCGGNFHTTIKRSDFGMKRFIPDVADEVRIDIAIEASPGKQ